MSTEPQQRVNRRGFQVRLLWMPCLAALTLLTATLGCATSSSDDAATTTTEDLATSTTLGEEPLVEEPVDGASEPSEASPDADPQADEVSPEIVEAAAQNWLFKTGIQSPADQDWQQRVDELCSVAIWELDTARAIAQKYLIEDGAGPDHVESYAPDGHGLNAVIALWGIAVQQCAERFPEETLQGGVIFLRGESEDPMVIPSIREVARLNWINITGVLGSTEDDWPERVDEICSVPIWDYDTAIAIAQRYLIEDGADPEYLEHPDNLADVGGRGVEALWLTAAQHCGGRFPEEALRAGIPSANGE